jgi:four helix bundle protein
MTNDEVEEAALRERSLCLKGGTMETGSSRRAYDLADRQIDFAVMIADIVEALPNARLGNHVAGQLIRSGTSPAPNYAEAQAAESRADFVHKLKVVLKELRETRVWLLIIQRKSLVRSVEAVSQALTECVELISIFAKSIKTARRNMEQGNE